MVTGSPQIRRGSPESLSAQIVAHYRAAIQQGRYRPGDRLPTIRAAAQELGVTRATVQRAYQELSETGLVIATVGRGTVVTGEDDAEVEGLFSAGARAALAQERSSPGAPSPPSGTQVRVNFADLLPDQALFPVDAFRAALESVLRERGGDLLVYGHPRGDLELRHAIAARPDEGGADEILITSGAQQGIDLVLRTFTAPGDAVAVAVPTYHHLFGLLRSHGLELVPVAQGADGIDPAELEEVLARPGVRLLYLIPTFHNPTGRTMGIEQRRALASVVARAGVPVLEDEFQRDLRFAGESLPSLRELGAADLTVTVRTFSKGLFPGIRMGWVQAAADVLSHMAPLKRLTDLDTSPLLQAALVEFMARGALDSYLDGLRTELGRRHDAAQEALRRAMPEGCTWSVPEGGYALWIELPTPDGDRLAELAAARGVLVTPGRVFTPDGGPSAGIRLSLSRVSPAQVAEGIEVLGRCAAEILEAQDTTSRRTFL